MAHQIYEMKALVYHGGEMFRLMKTSTPSWEFRRRNTAYYFHRAMRLRFAFSISTGNNFKQILNAVTVGIVEMVGSQCERSNTKGELWKAFGYSQVLEGYDVGQAEFVRVPFAYTVASLKVPENIKQTKSIISKRHSSCRLFWCWYGKRTTWRWCSSIWGRTNSLFCSHEFIFVRNSLSLFNRSLGNSFEQDQRSRYRNN